MSSLNIFALTSETYRIALSGTSARAQLSGADAAIPPGTYRVAASTDCYIKQGGSTVAASPSADIVFPAGVEFIDVRSSSDAYIAGITDGATGVVTITRVA